MINNKPSIYNVQSVYNQGGGSGAFDVDLGGGVSQTLVFPPYLQPVEYIDSSNYTGNKAFTIEIPEQIPIKSNRNELYIKFCVLINTDLLTSNSQIPFFYYPSYSSTGNDSIWMSVYRNGTYGDIVQGVNGWGSRQFYPIDTSKKINIIMDASLNLFKVEEIGGATYSDTDSRQKPDENYGRLLLFHSTSVNTFFYGRIYYGYIKNANTNNLLSFVVPARAKDPNDKKPYFVECISGSVGINVYNDLSTNGIVFGPDIDLSSEIPNWIT